MLPDKEVHCGWWKRPDVGRGGIARLDRGDAVRKDVAIDALAPKIVMRVGSLFFPGIVSAGLLHPRLAIDHLVAAFCGLIA